MKAPSLASGRGDGTGSILAGDGRHNHMHEASNMRLRTLLVAAAATLLGQLAQAQSWQLVWADEFNGAIGPDWVF